MHPAVPGHDRLAQDQSFTEPGVAQLPCAKPNDCWLSDITYIPTREGWLYLAVILDFVLAFDCWLGDEQGFRDQLAMDALEMGAAVIAAEDQQSYHSDQGSTYATSDYRDVLSRTTSGKA